MFRSKVIALSICVVGLAGCSSSPEFDIFGSYFPSWIVCLAIAIIPTVGVHFVIVKWKLADYLWPLALIYPSIICFVSCTLWIIFFE